jgi:D-alanine-D-alanine ligase
MGYPVWRTKKPLSITYTRYVTKVVVLCGGISDERDVSLRSGASVAKALETAGYHVELLDTGDDFDKHLAAMQASDVVFPVFHGIGGEDGVPQAYLESHGLTYVGSDASASRLCIDKWRTKELLRQHGLPTPAAEVVGASTIWDSPLVQKPFVLKPADGGSSVDTFIVRDVAVLDKAKIDAALQRYPQMLLEALVSGTEITVGVVGDEALPVIEIRPPADGEFDYENKYNGATQELCPPETVSTEQQKQAQDIALQVHQLCGCRDFSRTDFMIDSDSNLYVLEINTIPGMTDQSLLPKAAAAAGMNMSVLCDRLVKLALARKAA